MKKLFYVCLVLGVFTFSNSVFGQLLDEKNVTITMDLQPILQLDMTTPDHIDFVFDEIREYYAGVTKYGATHLKVSSSVSWDLWANGTSNNGSYWDQVIKYGAGSGTNAMDNLPLSALELYQFPNNAATGTASGLKADYSNPFGSVAAVTTGLNSIYHAAGNRYTRPAVDQKYIYGHNATGNASCGNGGSYLLQTSTPGVADAVTADYYYFILDYRILPGLPVIFPFAGDNAGASEALGAGSYAQPGVYTMDVKYLIMEDL